VAPKAITSWDGALMIEPFCTIQPERVRTSSVIAMWRSGMRCATGLNRY